jgi:hypothetical protein
VAAVGSRCVAPGCSMPPLICTHMRGSRYAKPSRGALLHEVTNLRNCRCCWGVKPRSVSHRTIMTGCSSW